MQTQLQTHSCPLQQFPPRSRSPSSCSCRTTGPPTSWPPRRPTKLSARGRRSWQQCQSRQTETTWASPCSIGSGQLASAPAMATCNARARPSPLSGAVSSLTEVFYAGQQNAWLRSASLFRSNTRTPTDFHPYHKALQSPRPRSQNDEPSRHRKTASSTRHPRSSLRTHAHPSTT
jgi:hypothetical protein